MPDHRPTGERTPAQRQADHASLGRLSESLVPALVQKLATSGLGELEVREGDWRIRLRRAAPAAATRRTERPRLGTHPERDGRGRDAAGTPVPVAAAPVGADTDDRAPASPGRTMALSPAVGVFHPEAAVGKRVRAGDRIAFVDLLGIAQDVTSPIDGTLVEVLPQAGEAVEYGEEVAAVASDVTVESEGARAAETAPETEAPGETAEATDEPQGEPPAQDASPDADAEASA
jgi:biotin carboxyl carrier protein